MSMKGGKGKGQRAPWTRGLLQRSIKSSTQGSLLLENSSSLLKSYLMLYIEVKPEVQIEEC